MAKQFPANQSQNNPLNQQYPTIKAETKRKPCLRAILKAIQTVKQFKQCQPSNNQLKAIKGSK
jgi:hypothetical protein